MLLVTHMQEQEYISIMLTLMHSKVMENRDLKISAWYFYLISDIIYKVITTWESVNARVCQR